MGAWMVLLALGRLRNETVWLNWAPGWFRLPARIAADSQAALGCISFPSFARLQPEGGTAVRSIPLMWHKRRGGFVARPKPGVSVTARVRGGFNSVPHLMFGVWNRTDLLPPAYIRGLTQLQDDVPPFPSDVARAMIGDELGQPAAAVFATLSDEPVAAASLGQVYRGTLLDGTDVAVGGYRRQGQKRPWRWRWRYWR